MKASDLKRVQSLLEKLSYIKEKITVLKLDDVRIQVSASGTIGERRHDVVHDVVIVRNQNIGCLKEDALNPVIKLILLQQMEELKESVERDLQALGVDPNA